MFRLSNLTRYVGLLCYVSTWLSQAVAQQIPLIEPDHHRRNASAALFTELEELARIVDISYCVGVAGLGVTKPFHCLSRCNDFAALELVTTWNTGPLLSDSCGFIAVDHAKARIILAFRGTYSITNTVIDLSTVPQEYIPYPGSDKDGDEEGSSRTDAALVRSVKQLLHPSNVPECKNCTVHAGFHTSWLHTRKAILPFVEEQIAAHPSYRLSLVGHSLGGAVAALAGLDFLARGWPTVVTTFGEPRVGNANFARYLEQRFGLRAEPPQNDVDLSFRRVTHVNDPVPLLPLTEWGYAMHAGEIHISKPSLSPDLVDVQLCAGSADPGCIAGQDATVLGESSGPLVRRDLLASVEGEIHEVTSEPWGIPSRYKLWQLFFAHRDYFWRLGLCVPGGDPLGGGKRYDWSKAE